jgi:riboflavin kinase / FMN adenylyltransferase
MIQVHRDLKSLPDFVNAVITIGTFDGVHLGHQQIIRLLKSEAAAISGETVIITFHPHPRKIVAGGKREIKTLNTLEEKIERLNVHGVEHLVVVPFTEAFANQPAEDYVKNFLVDKFHPHTIIIGYDHKFGKGREGDYHLLEDLGEKYNYVVKEIPEHVLNEIIISSTKVRDAISNCDILTANSFLGYDYFFEGTVIQGNKLGRTLGFPTANLFINNEEKLVPGNGVYAVDVQLEDEVYKGMMNIGVRPTVDGTNKVIEVNIFDFDRDIYGKILRVFVKFFLRGEQKFNSLEQLKEQLLKDKEEAGNLLGQKI